MNQLLDRRRAIMGFHYPGYHIIGSMLVPIGAYFTLPLAPVSESTYSFSATFFNDKKLYIAKCHLSHQTGKVHLLDFDENELEIEDI